MLVSIEFDRILYAPDVTINVVVVVVAVVDVVVVVVVVTDHLPYLTRERSEQDQEAERANADNILRKNKKINIPTLNSFYVCQIGRMKER